MDNKAKWTATPEVLGQFGDLCMELCREDVQAPAWGSDLSYCQAVAHYRAHPLATDAWYSTDDPWFLRHAETISRVMGLEIVTIEEGKRRVAAKEYVVYGGGIAEA